MISESETAQVEMKLDVTSIEDDFDSVLEGNLEQEQLKSKCCDAIAPYVLYFALCFMMFIAMFLIALTIALEMRTQYADTHLMTENMKIFQKTNF